MKRFKVCLALSQVLPACLATAAVHRVDINHASEWALVCALEGVAQQEARAIVDYRKEHGAFRSMEQLALVKGVDLGVVERNRERIVLGGVRDRMEWQAGRRRTR
ncbi:MAG: helix-hairpin-helix domain-containing protein [Pseudomonadota bacterium]|nr:helix-hairpin-helix domain-containing protein [Pseudomonadota bacterium]